MAELFETFDQSLYKKGVPLYQGDGTPLSDISNITPSSIGDGFSTGSTEMVTHALQSGTFLTGVRGWQIDAEGNAEFNDGTFRGTFNIGGTTITIDNTEDIQENLDAIETAGGGVLYLQNGTYTLTADISVPSGVTLEGVSRDGVIIDCDTSYKVNIVGSNAYSTGTVTINNGDTTVVGSGTTFTSAMVGRYILLDGLWYEITAFTDTTHITITTYNGSNLSGATYTIADVNFTGVLRKLTVVNATGSGVKVQYAQETFLDDIVVVECGTGIDLDQAVYPRIIAVSNFNGVNLDMNECYGWYIDFSDFSLSTIGAGVVMTNNSSATFFNTFVGDCATDGLSMTNSDTITFLSANFTGNGSQGVELISNNNDNQFIGCGFTGNLSDGIKLTATSDRNIISSSQITDNAGYGVNIAAANCDNNQIISPAFDNNTSGNINDSGTNTIILPNDPYITASTDLTAGQPVGISNIIGGLALAKKTSATVAHGLTTPVGGDYLGRYCPIGGDKFIILNYTTAASDTLFAQVGVRDGNVITMGTPQSVATAFTPFSGELITCCKLDTDKFIIFYLLDASTTVIKYRVGTVSGTTITFGSEATAVTAATTVATSVSWGADFLSTDKGVFFFKAATTTSSKVVAFTVSGTVASFGSPVTPGTESQKNVISVIKKIATDKFVLVSHIASASTYAQVFTCSGGTTITAGTEVQVSATTAGSPAYVNFQVVNPATDVFVFSWGSSRLLACTVSGTVPTAGTQIVAASGGAGVYAASATELYTANSSASAIINTVGLSGTTLTDNGAIFNIASTALAYAFMFPLDSGVFFQMGGFSNATNYTYFVLGMSNNFIGFVRTTVTKGMSAAVNIIGSINKTQSGLIPGGQYLINNGTVSFVASNVTVNTLDDIDVGVAVSSTQIII